MVRAVENSVTEMTSVIRVFGQEPPRRGCEKGDVSARCERFAATNQYAASAGRFLAVAASSR